MPRLMNNDQMETYRLGGAFSFAGTRIERLGATEYTLVTIAVDETGSVDGFRAELRDMLITAIEACRKSPLSEHLLIRVVTFSTKYSEGVNELHGFKPLSEIDTGDYPELRPGGMTPLIDACYSSLGAMNVYGKQLADDDFGVNGIAFIITDGGENDSTATMVMLKKEAQDAVTDEVMQSFTSVLVGINANVFAGELADFKDEAGLTEYIDAGEATKGKLAKLAAFVSQSISSQSQALVHGSPDQGVSVTF